MKIKFLFIFIILSFPVFSQTEDSLEFLLDFSADNLSVSEQRDDSEVMDYYESLIANPVNINTADEEQLLSIPFITPAEAKSIVGFRNLHGPFFSKAELYIIKDIPEEKLKRILPFVTHSIQQDKHTPGQLKSNLISRLRKKNLKYENNTAALNNYNSLRINYNDKIIAGFSTEKDDGEISYIDFYSGYVHLKDFYSFSSIVVGDFYIEEGEGLLLWSTGGIPKNSEVTNSVKKRRRGIVPKTGKNEMDFFRGAAIEKEINNLKFTGFFSYRYLDAAIDSSGNISRFIKDGYHRSITEIERKNSASVKTGGGTVLFSKEYINFGLNYYYSEFDRNFSGNRSKNGLSVSGSIIYDNISFFGEAAFINFSYALITGIHLFPSDGIEFITSYRNYSPDYMNMYGHGFAEKNGATQNESGVYTGLKIKIPFANIGFYF
ncbi:MAG: helix-hairpin-helix domain-containing protein, partial [Ignavibacteriales bacterium]